MDFATYEDVANAWRPLTTAEQTLATELILYAEAQLRARVPDIEVRITNGKLDPKLATLAVVQMVRRAMENASTVLSSRTVGPYTERYRDEARGLVQITEEDLVLVRPPAVATRQYGTARLRAGLA